MQDRPAPEEPKQRLNSALVKYINDLRLALALSNADKAALRAWAEGVRNGAQ